MTIIVSIFTKVTNDVIKKCYENKLIVRVVISDMGTANQKMWLDAGILSNRTSLVNFIIHPSNPLLKIFFMADPPHLLKSIRNCLLNNDIILPTIEETEHLKSKLVSLNHLKLVNQFQKTSNLKLLPGNTDDFFNLSNYKKMRVDMAAKLLSHSAASALYFMNSIGAAPLEVTTTAFFCDKVNEWFDILNNRTAHKFKKTTLENEISIIKNMSNLIKNISFSDNKKWKPIQKGIILTNETIMNLYSELTLDKIDFLFGRMNQDCIENLFSQIRSKSDSNPSALKFKINLKLVTISNYLKLSVKTNYNTDDSIYLLNMLQIKEKNELEQNDEVNFIKILEEETMNSNLIYYITGWNLFKEKLMCEECTLNYINMTNASNETSIFTHLKSYGKLIHPTTKLLNFFSSVNSFIDSCNLLQEVYNIENELLNKCINDVSFKIINCECHQHLINMIKRFIRLKLHTFAKEISNKNYLQ